MGEDVRRELLGLVSEQVRHVSADVDVSIHRELLAIAHERGVSLSVVVRWAVGAYADNYNKTKEE